MSASTAPPPHRPSGRDARALTAFLAMLVAREPGGLLEVRARLADGGMAQRFYPSRRLRHAARRAARARRRDRRVRRLRAAHPPGRRPHRARQAVGAVGRLRRHHLRRAAGVVRAGTRGDRPLGQRAQRACLLAAAAPRPARPGSGGQPAPGARARRLPQRCHQPGGDPAPARHPELQARPSHARHARALSPCAPLHALGGRRCPARPRSRARRCPVTRTYPAGRERRPAAAHRAGGLRAGAHRPTRRPPAQDRLPLPRRPHPFAARLRAPRAGLVLLRLPTRRLDLRPRRSALPASQRADATSSSCANACTSASTSRRPPVTRDPPTPSTSAQRSSCAWPRAPPAGSARRAYLFRAPPASRPPTIAQHAHDGSPIDTSARRSRMAPWSPGRAHRLGLASPRESSAA